MRVPPRILVLFGNVPLLGQELGNIEALDALAKSGCEVLFLIRGEWTRDTVQRELRRRGLAYITVPYFDALRHGMSPWIWVRNFAGILGGSWRLLRLIRSFRATHLHVGSLANLVNFAPALAIIRIPLVFRVGDVPQSHHALWRLAWRFACRRVDQFVSISQFLRDRIVSAGAPVAQVCVIYNRPPGRGELETSPTPNRVPGMHFIFIGQLIEEKGVGLLVEAAIATCKARADLRFSLAGHIDEKQVFVRELMASVRASGLEDRIVFHGYVADIARLLNEADVHVCPSLCLEGLGNVVLEAKAAGLPSIIFPSGGLLELVTHQRDGYVCAQPSVDALRSAFATYAAQPGIAKAEGQSARASLERLGAHEFSAKWRAVYDRRGATLRIIALFGNVPMLGQERANIATLAALRDTGAEVLVLIRGEWTQDTVQPALRQWGLEFVVVPYFDALRHGLPLAVWWRNIRAIVGGSRRLLGFIRSFGATHLHAGSIGNLVNFLPALLVTSLPLVFRAGDIPPQHHWLWRMVWRYARHRVRHFVCDSQFIERSLIALGADPRNLSVIYAPPPARKPGSAAIVARTRMMTFLYLGQVSPAKGVDLLVRAVAKLCAEGHEVRLLIAGDYTWNNPLGDRLRNEVRAAGLEERICFLGFVEDIESLFAAADVHVFPSIGPEAYGLTVIEAMQRGVPSIVFPAGGVVELVQDGVTGWVCKAPDFASLLDGLRYYLLNPDIVRRQGLAAMESLNRFKFERYGERWRGVYENVGNA